MTAKKTGLMAGLISAIMAGDAQGTYSPDRLGRGGGSRRNPLRPSGGPSWMKGRPQLPPRRERNRDQEQARRRRQIAKGMLKEENGLRRES